MPHHLRRANAAGVKPWIRTRFANVAGQKKFRRRPILVPKLGTRMRRSKFSATSPASQAECERDEGPPASVVGCLFTATRRRLLGFLFGQTDRAFHMQELFASTGTGNGAVRPGLDLVLVLKPDAAEPDGRDVLDALHAAEQRLLRACTLTRIVRREAIANPDPFLSAVLAQPRIWVFGHETALSAMTYGP